MMYVEIKTSRVTVRCSFFFSPKENTINQSYYTVFSKGNCTCRGVEERNELPAFVPPVISIYLHIAKS